ncbi:MAG: hypothetical protein AAF429_05085 [Pseudomonadota bacterium]
MNEQSNLISFSGLSAIGALPFLVLPAFMASSHVSGDDAILLVSSLAIALTVGEFLSSVVCPKFTRISLKNAIFASFALGVLLTVCSLGASFLELIIWTLVGFLGGAMQYLATTFAACCKHPSIATQLRLSFSMLLSGGMITTSAIWISAGFDIIKYGMSCLAILPALVAFIFQPSERNLPKDKALPKSKSAKASFGTVLMAHSSICFFYFAIIPFLTVLPVVITAQNASLTAFQIGMGKILAMPLLLLLSKYNRVMDLKFAATFFGLLLCSSGFMIVFQTSITSFVLFEFSANTCAAILIGRYGTLLKPRDIRWFFLFIQIGTVLGFFVLSILERLFIDMSWISYALIIPAFFMMFCPAPERRKTYLKLSS